MSIAIPNFYALLHWYQGLNQRLAKLEKIVANHDEDLHIRAAADLQSKEEEEMIVVGFLGKVGAQLAG